MIKIAYIIDTIATPNAGTEKQLLMLLHGLNRDAFEPTLICLRPSEWLRQQSFPFEVHVLDVGAILRPSLFGTVARFKAFHRVEQFDLVQTFFVDANIFGTIAAHCAGVRTIISSRRNIGYWHTGIHTTLLRFLRRWTTHYLANSKAVLDVSLRHEGVPADRISVIYNGLDLTRFEHLDPSLRRQQREAWKITDSQILIGVVANLRPVKNLPSFIHAAAELKERYPHARFVVVGEGPDRADLQARIDSAGLTDRFLLAGVHSDVLPCLAALDIAVQCSFSESFSGSLVEYMAAGLPIAAANVGGNPEAVTSDRTGLLYESDHGPNLVACLRKLLDDPARARTLGGAARLAAFERYSREACIRKHEEFYRQIVDKVKQR